MSKKVRNTINELMALDAMLDTMVFGKPLGVFGEKATKEDIEKVKDAIFGKAENDAEKVSRLCTKVHTLATPSIIGKRYEVRDNSYAMCRTTDCEVGGLHGKVYTIVSEPYMTKVRTVGVETKDALMVDVKSDDTGLDYSVLFEENWIIAENGKSYWENYEERNKPKRGLFGF